MLLIDRLTDSVPQTAKLFEKAHPLKVHPDVIALAGHLAQDEDKLQQAAGHIFWPDYETWLEWEDERGRIGFYFDGSKEESVTAGRGMWVAWEHGQTEPAIVSLKYDMPGYKLAPLDPRQEMQESLHLLPVQERTKLLMMAERMLPKQEDFSKQMFLRATADSLRPVIYAILALINSPKLIRQQRISQERINRARLKRGKFAFHPHHEVRLAVDQTVLKSIVGGKGNRSHKALHFVRSHLRFRLGQYELVRPHWRGDAEVGVIATEYAAGMKRSKWKD